MKKKILAVAGATMLALIAIPAAANAADTDTQKSNNVSVNVKGGAFSLDTSAINPFASHTLKDNTEVVSTSFAAPFTVKDLSGLQSGYRVDVKASQFKDGSGNTIKAGSLTLDPVSTVTRTAIGSGGTAPTASTTAPAIVDNGATVKVLSASAGNGMGVFDVAFPSNALDLTIDPTTTKATAAGATYTSTLEWNLIQAP
jgi:hypothetical protein